MESGMKKILFNIVFLISTALFSSVFAQDASSYPANIDYPNVGNYGNYSTQALKNPNIGGVDVTLYWN